MAIINLCSIHTGCPGDNVTGVALPDGYDGTGQGAPAELSYNTTQSEDPLVGAGAPLWDEDVMVYIENVRLWDIDTNDPRLYESLDEVDSPLLISVASGTSVNNIKFLTNPMNYQLEFLVLGNIVGHAGTSANPAGDALTIEVPIKLTNNGSIIAGGGGGVSGESGTSSSALTNRGCTDHLNDTIVGHSILFYKTDPAERSIYNCNTYYEPGADKGNTPHTSYDFDRSYDGIHSNVAIEHHGKIFTHFGGASTASGTCTGSEVDYNIHDANQLWIHRWRQPTSCPGALGGSGGSGQGFQTLIAEGGFGGDTRSCPGIVINCGLADPNKSVFSGSFAETTDPAHICSGCDSNNQKTTPNLIGGAGTTGGDGAIFGKVGQDKTSTNPTIPTGWVHASIQTSQGNETGIFEMGMYEDSNEGGIHEARWFYQGTEIAYIQDEDCINLQTSTKYITYSQSGHTLDGYKFKFTFWSEGGSHQETLDGRDVYGISYIAP